MPGREAKGADMQCPNCQSEVREGAAFCGSCGATVPLEPVPVAGDAAQPTVPLPQPVVAPQPVVQPTTPLPQASTQSDYERQMAEYERQKAAYDQQQYAQQQAAYQQQTAAYATPAVPPKKSKTGMIVAIVIAAVVLLLGCGVGGVFALRAMQAKPQVPDVTAPSTTDSDEGGVDTGDSGTTDTGAAAGYATAEEAVVAQLADAGLGDWTYRLHDEGAGSAVYWAGPPNSEFVDEISLEQNADGAWSVVTVQGLEFGGDVSEGDVGPEAEAMQVVIDYLVAVSEDRGDDAHTYTVEPFASDGASAMVSAGGMGGFDVSSATGQSDGSYWVRTTQEWYGSSENWEYWVVPTELGYYIADVRPW